MLEIGSIVDGKYKILNKIGQGGMSVVYLAMNERANKQWAIKEVRKDGVSNFEIVKQGLIAETDMLKNLNHPNLPSIIDVIDGDGTFLIVMDYIEGTSLDSILKHHGAQSQEDVIEWSIQLCDVLGYLHTREKPIVYRDMKPANVMLKPDGTVTLIDFGTAREFKSAAVADTTCLGTQGYAAPEQFGGMGQTDGRTDIYCLGATMYHLVTGHNPAEPPYEMYPIRQWDPRLSSGLEEIILKCTQRNPEDRYQSCAELMYALEHYKDLENESKREYNKKWKLFLSSVIMCGVCLVGTLGTKYAAEAKKSDTYDMYMEDARTAVSGKRYEDAEQEYLNAIEIEPSNITAYDELFQKVYFADQMIQAEERKVIKQEFTKSRLEKLKSEDKESYYELMNEMGKKFFYMYDNEEVGRETAGEFFNRAYDEGKTTLNEKEKRNLELHIFICENSSKLGSNVTLDDGTSLFSYKEYWDQIVELVEQSYDLTQDRLLAVRAYEEFYQTAYLYRDSFYQEGIQYSEILQKMIDVKDKLSEIKDLEEGGEKKLLPPSIDLERDINQIEDNIGQLNGKINISQDKGNKKDD